MFLSVTQLCFSDGTTEATEEDVWQNKSTGHHYNASNALFLSVHLLLKGRK